MGILVKEDGTISENVEFQPKGLYEECNECGTEGEYIERTTGWWIDNDVHAHADYFVCPNCKFDWTSYYVDGDGYIISYTGWTDHNG